MLGTIVHYVDLENHLEKEIGVEWTYMALKRKSVLDDILHNKLPSSSKTNYKGEPVVEYGKGWELTKEDLLKLHKEESGQLHSITFRYGNSEGYVVELQFESGNHMNIKFSDKGMYLQIIEYLNGFSQQK